MLATRDYVDAANKKTKEFLDELYRLIEIKADMTAVQNRSYVFTKHAELQLLVTPDMSFLTISVDESVNLDDGRCRVLAPEGEKIKIRKRLVDGVNFLQNNLRYTFERVNGVWKV